MNDSLGTPIEVGDFVLSASTTHGRVKLGRVEQGPNSLRMNITASFHWGKRETDGPKRQSFGTNVIVLEEADGTIPEPLGALLG